ncbi:MAG: thiazole synthase [Bacteriovoracales bacterium]
MWELFGKKINSRLLLGTSRYPSLDILKGCIRESGCEIVTVSLRRSGNSKENGFFKALKDLNLNLLPNTAGCTSVDEAVTTAYMARELFNTDWIKLEVIGDDYTLRPDPFGLIEAAKILVNDGFKVFPYMTEDLVVAEKLLNLGCKILMPWASPIGSGQGITNILGLKMMRERFKDIPLIVDAGIGRPSDAALAMEIGFDGVLLNSAVSLAVDPPEMAKGFSLAIKAGRSGYLAGIMEKREFATPSTPVVGKPFWHGNFSK